MKLIKSVRLPYNITRGSFEYRQYKAEQFTHKVMQEVSAPINSEGISLSKLGRLLKKALPANLAVYVQKCKLSDAGAQVLDIYSKNNYIVGRAIELQTNDNARISRSQVPTITHEIRHLADSLFHPKFLAREQKVSQKKLNIAKYLKFYDENIYVQEDFNGKKDKKRIIKLIRNQTKKILRGLDAADKIDLLQNMRFNLMSEQNAYSDGYKSAKKLYKKYVPVYEDTLNYPNSGYMFAEKIELFKDMISEIIKQERQIHRAKLKNRR